MKPLSNPDEEIARLLHPPLAEGARKNSYVAINRWLTRDYYMNWAYVLIWLVPVPYHCLACPLQILYRTIAFTNVDVHAPYEKVATENERFPAVILIAPYHVVEYRKL